MHHGILFVLALKSYIDRPIRRNGQGVSAELGIGRPAQSLPRIQRCQTGQLHGHNHKDRQQRHHRADQDGHHTGTPLQRLAKPLSHKLVPGRANHNTDQGHRLEAGPFHQGGGGSQNAPSAHQDQGLQHQHQGASPGLFPLQQQIDQKAQRNGAAAAHTKRQQERQGVDVEAHQMEPAVAFLLRGTRQTQREEHPNAHTPGKHIGVAKNGSHSDPRFYSPKVVIVLGKQLQQAQHRRADQMGGEQVDAHQTCNGRSTLQHRGKSTSQLVILASGKGQKQKEARSTTKAHRANLPETAYRVEMPFMITHRLSAKNGTDSRAANCLCRSNRTAIVQIAATMVIPFAVEALLRHIIRIINNDQDGRQANPSGIPAGFHQSRSRFLCFTG